MSDLTEALAKCHERFLGEQLPEPEDVELIMAAARNWHALTNPTDELIERLIATLDQLPEHIGSDGITDAILDALTDTAEPE